MTTRTIIFPVPVYPDTDLSYRYQQVRDLIAREVNAMFFPGEYSYDLEPLRGAETYEAAGQTYVKATFHADFPDYSNIDRLGLKLCNEAEKLP